MNKKFLIIASSIVLMVAALSSCLTSNTESIEAYTHNHISDVTGVWYRYITVENESSDREVMRKVELDGIERVIDEEARLVTIKVNPSQGRLNSIPEAARAELSVSNIGVVVALPTAARLFPVGNSPKLGINGDWSKPNKYIVRAANGDEAEWTIKITEFNK